MSVAKIKSDKSKSVLLVMRFIMVKEKDLFTEKKKKTVVSVFPFRQ